MNRKTYGLLLGSAWVLVSPQSYGATDCTGTLTHALLYSDGSVNIRSSWRNDFTVVCNTNGTFGAVPPEICLSWYATAVKAVADGRQLSVYYGATYTCATLPTYWSAPVPTYVGLM